jgi:hypothetical protein
MDEAEILTQYLIGESADKQVRALYDRFLASNDTAFDAVDAQIWSRILQRPGMLPWFDAGLAVVRPESEVRRRLFSFLAILETQTLYTRHFLSRKRSIWYLIYVFLIGVRGSIRMVFGALLVKRYVRRYGNE